MVRILVIADDAIFRASLQGLLEGAGYAVVAVRALGNGFRPSRQERFDLAICDLFTPGNDGLSTLDEILRMFPETPIIATAGRAALGPNAEAAQSERRLRIAKQRGAVHTFLKPFDIEAFLALVRHTVVQPA